MSRTRFPVLILFAALGACLLNGAACRADSYALLIGIDQYQQNDAINGLAGASNDAKGLARTLEQVSGFPADHVRVLTSDGETRPTGANITFELDQLSGRAKAGDLVFVLFSGHGIEMDGKTYLVPWDADARTESTLKRTSLPEADVRAQLSQISARGLILAFDMCRSDPRKGSKAVQRDNLMGRQAKDLRVVPVSAGGDAPGPRAVVTLFSCSRGERSWEWRDKERGFFSFYLEQGLRRDAADAKGVVRVGSLVTYLEKSVAGAVRREQGRDQRPYSIMEGTGAQGLVLARGRAGGATDAVIVPAPPDAGPDTATDAGGALDGRLDAVLRQGKALIRGRQWDDAQAKYAAALELQPASARAAAGLGQVALGLKRPDEAERQFRQALQRDARSVDAVRGLAEVAYRRHDRAEAERLIRQALALDPKDADSVCDLGMLTLDKYDTAGAERLFRQARSLDPGSSDAQVGLGAVALKRGDTVQAESLFRQALQTDPKSAPAYVGLGGVAEKGNDGAQAQSYLKQALDLDPSLAEAVCALAGLAVSVDKDPAEAERLFHKAIALDPTSATPVLGLAAVSLAKKDFDEAQKLAQAGHDMDPKDPDGFEMLGLLALQRRDAAAATNFLRQAIALDPGNGEYHYFYAACLFARLRLSEAMSESRKAKALGYKPPPSSE